MTTEPNVLTELIPPSTMFTKLLATNTASLVLAPDGSLAARDYPKASLSIVPWRKSNVKYTQNEIYIDVEETIDVIVACNGRVLRSVVIGDVFCAAYLSGMPDISMVFSDNSVIDNAQLHQCVRFSKFERERVVSFVPPDGKCHLMRYFVNNVVLPVEIHAEIDFDEDKRSGIVNVKFVPKVLSGFGSQNESKQSGIADCFVVIPFGNEVESIELNVDNGSVAFDTESKQVVWNIGDLKRGRSASLSGHVTLDKTRAVPLSTPNVSVKFKIEQVSVTGIYVKSLSILNESYGFYKGLKCTTLAGKYEFRTS